MSILWVKIWKETTLDWKIISLDHDSWIVGIVNFPSFNESCRKPVCMVYKYDSGLKWTWCQVTASPKVSYTCDPESLQYSSFFGRWVKYWPDDCEWWRTVLRSGFSVSRFLRFSSPLGLHGVEQLPLPPKMFQFLNPTIEYDEIYLTWSICCRVYNEEWKKSSQISIVSRRMVRWWLRLVAYFSPYFKQEPFS